MKYILILLLTIIATCTSAQSSPITFDPTYLWIYQNTPNPFSEWTEIRFYIPEDNMDVIIGVYNKKAECVKVLAKGKFDKGEHKVSYYNANHFRGTMYYQMVVNSWKSPVMYMTMY